MRCHYIITNCVAACSVASLAPSFLKSTVDMTADSAPLGGVDGIPKYDEHITIIGNNEYALGPTHLWLSHTTMILIIASVRVKTPSYSA